jgi:sulfite exporter TauE/SafE
MLNGLLPCGLVYVALGTALTLGDPARGMIFLAGFGAGTIPALLGVGFAGKILRGRGRRLLAIGLPIFTAALAILLILRGLNLGIPMVSPKVSVSHSAPAEPSCCGGG